LYLVHCDAIESETSAAHTALLSAHPTAAATTPKTITAAPTAATAAPTASVFVRPAPNVRAFAATNIGAAATTAATTANELNVGRLEVERTPAIGEKHRQTAGGHVDAPSHL
jgi:hypothetical protein